MRRYLLIGLLSIASRFAFACEPIVAEDQPSAVPDSEVKAPDFTQPDLKKLKLSWVEPTKDAKTGFVVGGKNETAAIGKLIALNGRTIADLEKDMRPGAEVLGGSDAGFLGKDEKLVHVLAADNEFVVDKQKSTHQDLARHLLILAAIPQHALADGKQEFRYHGRRFRVDVHYSRGYQESPFHDKTRANADATVYNLDNGKKLSYSLLVPMMIERYGFYEGKGTPYRVDPRDVLAVLDFLKKESGARK